MLWVGLNYERREVRDYFYAMIRELVMDYDALGLKLNFLRTPAICEPGATPEVVDTGRWRFGGPAGKPKQYALATMLGPVWNPPFDTPDQLPHILEPDWRHAFRLPMCTEPTDLGLQLIVQVVVDRRDDVPPIGVSFNDSWPTFASVATDELLFPHLDYTHHVPEYTAFNYTFDVARIVEGWNENSVYNGCHDRRTDRERRDNAVTIRSLELAVR